MRNLRLQLLVSHLLLVILMASVMLIAGLNVVHLSHSIGRILKNNYASVIAAQNMKEALERQDSAATFFLAGQTQKAHQQFTAYKAPFEKAYHAEAHNITEPGEKELANEIGERYALYQQQIRRLFDANPPLSTPVARNYYFSTLEPSFLRIKQRAQDILDLNQAAMLSSHDTARIEADNVTRITFGTTIISLLLAFLIALQMIRLAMQPLRRLAAHAEAIGAGNLNQQINLHRNDEIGVLADAFNVMVEKLRIARTAIEERLNRAERMSDAALEHLYDPVLVTDADGRVVHLNPAAEGLFGESEKVVQKLVTQVVHETRITEAIEQAIRHEEISCGEGETAFVGFKSGEDERTYRLRVNPMFHKNHDHQKETVLGAVAVLEDVTYLRELDRLKTEFVGVASHELKTPVTSLLLSVQLMQEGAAGELTASQREIVAAQRDDLKRLERMMDDLLDITRLEAEANPPRLEMVAPEELVSAAICSVQNQANAKGIYLTGDSERKTNTILRVDQQQMVRVLINLLNNAIRHTLPNGSVCLSLSEPGRESTNPSVVFIVSDTGSGIPANYLPHIFDRFVQVPGATQGGAGLGLSIVQNIVRAHGGTITVHSIVGEGTTFKISLPVAGCT